LLWNRFFDHGQITSHVINNVLSFVVGKCVGIGAVDGGRVQCQPEKEQKENGNRTAALPRFTGGAGFLIHIAGNPVPTLGEPSKFVQPSLVANCAVLAKSAPVAQISFKQSGTTRMTTTKAYDYLNRLTSISHADATPATLASYAYGYNAANQRTNVVHADGSYWNYGYDALGQVISAKKRKLGDLLFPGLQYEFEYDDIGNRTQTRTGGDASGANLRTNNYTANALNQYTSRDIRPYVEVHGQAATNATVTVNNLATERAGTFFRKELNPDNSAAVVNQGITNVAVLKNAGPDSKDIVSTETGSRLLPQNPENFTYDADGNLLSDGLWNYVWNGENRLIELTASTNVPATSRKKLEFSYDHQGRRRSKTVYTWNSGTSSYDSASTNLFVYDGWNLIAELNPSATLIRSYVWGLDLSGSEQGAGGVGGLLMVADTATHFAGHDGNGNVMLLASADTATITAQYEYSPFGKVIRASGTMADANPIRFSGKYEDSEIRLQLLRPPFLQPRFCPMAK
jgi:YD repeat-containing protein